MLQHRACDDQVTLGIQKVPTHETFLHAECLELGLCVFTWVSEKLLNRSNLDPEWGLSSAAGPRLI